MHYIHGLSSLNQCGKSTPSLKSVLMCWAVQLLSGYCQYYKRKGTGIKIVLPIKKEKTEDIDLLLSGPSTKLLSLIPGST